MARTRQCPAYSTCSSEGMIVTSLSTPVSSQRKPSARLRTLAAVRWSALLLALLAGLSAALCAVYLLHAGQPADLIPPWAVVVPALDAIVAVAFSGAYAIAAWGGRIRGRPRSSALASTPLTARITPLAFVAAAGAVLAALVALFSAPQLGTVKLYSIAALSGGSARQAIPSIVVGQDGNLWFTAFTSNQIGRLSPAGAVHLFSVPTSGGQPAGITTGPDGNLWFTESGANQIGRLSPSGEIREFRLPTPSSQPLGITTGPDGNLWFTETRTSRIGRITPSGIIREYALPINGGPIAITTGLDGKVWFTLASANEIGSISSSGTIRLLRLTAPMAQPLGIALGPDGNVWFTEAGANQIGRVMPSGKIYEYPVLAPVGNSGQTYTPYHLTAGADGNLWFTIVGGRWIGRISPTGTLRLFEVGSTSGRLDAIASGPNGNLWFTYDGTNVIGRIAP